MSQSYTVGILHPDDMSFPLLQNNKELVDRFINEFYTVLTNLGESTLPGTTSDYIISVFRAQGYWKIHSGSYNFTIFFNFTDGFSYEEIDLKTGTIWTSQDDIRLMQTIKEDTIRMQQEEQDEWDRQHVNITHTREEIEEHEADDRVKELKEKL